MNTLEPLASALLIISPVITFSYVVQCAIRPYHACRRCGGFGQLHGPFGAIRFCRCCDGTGLRLRLGRRMWNVLYRLYRDIDGGE